MDQSAQARIEQLERLVSELRHDMRGAISPAVLIADRLMRNGDPVVQRSGRTIQAVVDRVLSILEATTPIVPPRGGPG
jgi:hypothetical protein